MITKRLILRSIYTVVHLFRMKLKKFVSKDHSKSLTDVLNILQDGFDLIKIIIDLKKPIFDIAAMRIKP